MKSFKFNVKPALLVLGKVLFVTIAVAVFYLCMKEYTSDKSNVALVNINAIVNRYIHTMAKSKLDEPTLQKHTGIFMKKLENEISKVAKEKKIGLLVSDAIVAGGVDYTANIEKSVYREYNKEIKK